MARHSMQKWPFLQLLLLICAAGVLLPQAATALDLCPDRAMQGEQSFQDGSCAWDARQPVPAAANGVELRGNQAAFFSAVNISLTIPHNASDSVQTKPGFSLSIRRLKLLNVVLARPTQEAVPKLLPLGLFAAAPSKLSMMDVRLVVPTPVFDEFLTFFSRFLRPVREKQDGGVGMHTDGRSFLNVPYFQDNYTELYSVTLVAGPCAPSSATQAGEDIFVELTSSQTAPRGCNVRMLNNDTLVPTLLRDGAINTTEPLLVRLVTNVSLGPDLERPIVLRRPVLLLGTTSAPVSVDLGMVVNQLDTTAPTARISFQSLVIENIAPGDATSAVMAPPYSTTVTLNLWAVYCNRSSDSCLAVANCTLVTPSQDEISYLIFMATMFNSPSPSLRQLADFYITDLHMRTFQFEPGPTNDTIRILRLITDAWDLWSATLTTQPVFAKPLPAPRQVFNQLQYKTGVLVQAIKDCSSFQATQGFAANRVHVWQLTSNVTIDGACAAKPILVTGPTTLLGEAASAPDESCSSSSPGPGNPPMRIYPLSAAAYAAAANRTANSTTGPQPNTTAATAPTSSSSTKHSLSFHFTPSLFQLPATATDRYMQVRNITLHQLPQIHEHAAGAVTAAAPAPAPGSSKNSTGSGGRRLLQAGFADESGSLSKATDPGIWTVLLHSVNRTMAGTSLTVADSQLMLPEPEWRALAAAAKASRHFEVQLQGDKELIFTATTLLPDDVLRVATFQGPGITGSNVELLIDPIAAAQPGYHWPEAAVAAAAAAAAGAGDTAATSSDSNSGGGTSGLSRGGVAALGVVLGAVVVLAIVLVAALLLRRRLRRRRQQQQLPSKGLQQHAAAAAAAGRASMDELLPPSHHSSKRSGAVSAAQGSCVADADDSAVRDQEYRHQHDPQHHDPMHAAGSWQRQHQQQHQQQSSQRRHSHKDTTATGVGSASDPPIVLPEPSLSEPLPNIAARSPDCTTQGPLPCRRPSQYSYAEGAGSTGGRVGSDGRPLSTPLSEAELIEEGLRQWNNAVSLQTMRLMQARLQAASQRSSQQQRSLSQAAATGSTPSTSTTSSTQQFPVQGGRQGGLTQSVGTIAAAGGGVGGAGGAGGGSGAAPPEPPAQELELYEVIGQGSFGAVHVGSWRSKQVAVKIMHLPAHAFNTGSAGQPAVGGGRQQGQAQHQSSRPQMAITEAVLASNLHHPNIVQVYTYMLTPLMANCGGSAGNSRQLPGDVGAGTSSKPRGVSGFQLQLVMEWCNEGTLRDALDRRLLPHQPNSSLLNPTVAVALAHDIAAAMLHLHTEGIVHGDLKAGNVLLQACTAPVGRTSNPLDPQREVVNAWIGAGSVPLIAKVADFGLALPLGPQDTHATMLVRGTPTHMSPELFESGHVGKPSDVYAFGILLYEILTGRRAHAGVPVPLLPHKVAVERLRPVWPPGVLPELQELAEACWAHKPQDRPHFQTIIQTLEAVQMQRFAPSAAAAAATSPDAAVGGGAPRRNSSRAKLESALARGKQVGALPPRATGKPASAVQPQQQQEQQEHPVQAAAAAAAAVASPPRLQQQQQGSQRVQVPVVRMSPPGAGAGAAGLFAGGASSSGSGGQRDGMMGWSEVSYGRSEKYSRAAKKSSPHRQ